MANAETVLDGPSARRQPSLLRLTLVALVAALAFDAVSTALAWNVVVALPATLRRAPVHAVRPADVRDPSRHASPDAPDAAPSAR